MDGKIINENILLEDKMYYLALVSNDQLTMVVSSSYANDLNCYLMSMMIGALSQLLSPLIGVAVVVAVAAADSSFDRAVAILVRI